MGNIIPFFHYDLLARVVPGALTLAVLAYVGVELPERWVPLLSGDTAWGAVVIPLALAGSSYVIGVLYETAFALPPLRQGSEWLGRVAFDRAYRHKHHVQYGWRDPVRLKKLLCALKEEEVSAKDWLENLEEIEKDLAIVPPTKNGKTKCAGKLRSRIRKCERELRFTRLDDVVHAAIGEKAPLFAHALRFQSEARMCLHCFTPMVVLCVYAFCDCLAYGCTQQWLQAFTALVFLVPLACGIYAREWRRWLQILIAAKYILNVPRSGSSATG